MPITVFVPVSPVYKAQYNIPDWKNPIVSAAIDREQLHASGVHNYDILVNGQPANIYTKVAEGDHIELIPTGG